MRKRNLVFVLVLSIVTVGLYDIYWAFSTRNELKRLGQDVPSPWIAFLPTIGLFTIIFAQLFIHYHEANNALQYGVNNSNGLVTIINIFSAIFGFIAVVAILPLALYWLWKYSEAVENITKGALTTGASFGLAIVLGMFGGIVVWPAIIQYHFNKISETS